MAKKAKTHARKAAKARKVARKYSYATKFNSAVSKPFADAKALGKIAFGKPFNALQNGFTSIMGYFK